MSDNRFTPESIAKSNQVFNIPLYQRLFEWGEQQIERLLDDLYQSFKKAHDKPEPYYIGMLTAIRHNKILDLVDGQQRFTVMMLLGKTFGWDDFTKPNNNPRLKFAARPSDERYLKSLLEIEQLSEEELKRDQNYKMHKGLEFINKYLKTVTDINAFGDYIKKNLTFFVTELEDTYTITELNTYFERMNTTGKALEQHEILKVTLLEKLDKPIRETYTKIWNACSMMDRMLYRPKRQDKEQSEEAEKNSYQNCRSEYEKAIKTLISLQEGETDYSELELIADFKENDDYNGAPRIREIQQMDEPEKNNPNKKKNQRRDVYAIPTFPEFLLQVLFITLGYANDIKNTGTIEDINNINITDFFNVHKLNDTFKECQDKFNVEDFFNNLFLFRLILDYYIVLLSDNDEDPYPFKLYYDNNDKKKEIFQYETMLYAASSPMTYYYWIAPFLVWIREEIKKYKTIYIDESTILNTLETLDNNWHPNICDGKSDKEIASELRYGNIDRYYLWRIDYYLWKNRDVFFNVTEKEKENKLASSYIFRRNRSIEHIAPQHFGDDKNRFNWGELQPEEAAFKDSVGNLCMISSGQNSSLQDSAFEEKRGHIESFLNDSIKGYVESLKMLYVYSMYQTWTLENIKAHEEESIKWLRESYNQGLTVTP